MILQSVILLIVLIIFYMVYFNKREEKISIPEGYLFFYSMEGCPYCEKMQKVLESTDIGEIKVFKINLRGAKTEYSIDDENMKNECSKYSIEAYPTLLFKDQKHLGSLSQEELLIFLNI